MFLRTLASLVILAAGFAAPATANTQTCLMDFVSAMAKSSTTATVNDKICASVETYKECLQDISPALTETELAASLKAVSDYEEQCKPVGQGPDISTEEGSLSFSVDNDKSLLFHRRAAHTIDVMELSDRLDAVEKLSASLPASVETRLKDGRDILAKVSTDVIAEYTNTVQSKLDQQDLSIAQTTGKLKADNEAAAAASQKLLDDATASMTALEADIRKDVAATNAVLKADLEKLKITSQKLVNGFLGFNEATPGDSCAAIKAVRPTSINQAQWIVNAINKKMAIRVWCANIGDKYVNLGGDGSDKNNAAVSCDGNPLATANANSKRWIDPDNNVDNQSNAALTQCETRLMLKLVTTDSNIQHYRAKFWSDAALLNEDQANDGDWEKSEDDIKAAAYMTPIGKTIEIVGMIKGVQVGRAVYNIRGEFQKRSLQYLVVHGGANMVIGQRDNKRSSTNKPFYNRYARRQGATPYDMFMDTAGDLMVRQRNYAGSTNSWTRLSTTDRSTSSGCHRYSGIGGDHYCNGWSLSYEAMPIVSYCYAQNRYGTNHKNTMGGSTASCGSARVTNMDFAILKNPK